MWWEYVRPNRWGFHGQSTGSSQTNIFVGYYQRLFLGKAANTASTGVPLMIHSSSLGYILLNSFHLSLQFNMEEGIDGTLLFLDILVERKDSLLSPAFIANLHLLFCIQIGISLFLSPERSPRFLLELNALLNGKLSFSRNRHLLDPLCIPCI